LNELKGKPVLELSPKNRVSEEHVAKKSFSKGSSSREDEESKKSLNYNRASILESFEGSMNSSKNLGGSGMSLDPLEKSGSQMFELQLSRFNARMQGQDL
jgi:hypothetical protein